MYIDWLDRFPLCFGVSGVLVGSRRTQGQRSQPSTCFGTHYKTVHYVTRCLLPVSAYFRLAHQTHQNREEVYQANQYTFITFLIILHVHNYTLYQFITGFRIANTAITTILSTVQILPYKDLLLYIILIFCNFSNIIYKLPKDDVLAL